jgi:hypothetical protein
MSTSELHLVQLWWQGIISPRRAYDELRSKPAPQWGFWVVVTFNLLISATTLLAQYLLRQDLVMPSWLTFLPDDKYLLYEMFFLPPLRVLVWIASAGITHLGLRMIRQPGGFDQLLNMGGLGYLIVMPITLASDWVLVALDRYDLAQFTHSLLLPWAFYLTVVGMKVVLGVKTSTAAILFLISTALTLPLLAIFAR